MILEKIVLKDFRNFEKLNLSLSGGANIISGMNAQGKSNFIEAVYYCAFLRSFRNSKDSDLIKSGEKNFYINLIFKNEKREENIEIIYSESEGKKITLNEVPVKKISEIIGKLKIVCFTPEDSSLVTGSPSYRRKFLDRQLSQIYPAYLKDLLDYNYIIQQRNSALKLNKIKKSDLNLISMWDESLSQKAENIMKKRNDYINKLDYFSSILHNMLSGEEEQLKLSYLSIINSQKRENYVKIKDVIKNILKENLENDLRYGYTTVGPHKDDFSIFIDGKESKKFSSQGQKKLAALSIKLAQIDIIKEINDVEPVVLLDDISSELDERRRLFLFEYICKYQSFMTTTDVEIFGKKLKDIKHIVAENGIFREADFCKTN